MTASARSGKNTGPGSPRSTAMSRATTRISTSAMQKILMFTRNACAISGNDSRKIWPLKNWRLTSGQPGELTIAATTIATNTTVLAIKPRALLQDRDAGLRGKPLALDLREGAVRLERGDRLVHARRQRAALLQHEPEVLLAADRRELADDEAVRHLLGTGDVERRRQVDDDPVDLLRLQAGIDVVGGVVDRRLLARLDVLRDVVVARRPELDAELVLLDVGRALRVRDRGALDADERLVDVVVAVAEVDALRSLRRERNLVDVEVEGLRAGLEGLVERDDDPVDRVAREAEPLSHRVSDGALEALAAGRVADLPDRPLRGSATKPRREGRVVGADRQLARLDERKVGDRAAGARGAAGG